MNLRMIAAVAGFLLIYGLLNAYIGWNSWLFLSAVTGWDNPFVYSIVIAFLALAYLLGRLAQSTFLRPVAGQVKLIGSYWIAIFQYSLLIFPIADLVGVILKWSGASRDIYLTMTGGIAALVLLILLALGTRNAWSPVIRRYFVAIEKPAGARNKLTIAMASDLHLGTTIGKRHLERLVKSVNRIKPDIILLPGDILDDEIAPYQHHNMGSVLGKLQAPLGVYAVTGNHEYIGRKVPEFVAEMDAIGIRVLMDETAIVDDSFIVIGRKDKAAGSFGAQGRMSIAELTATLDASKPLIMLDHQPSDLAAAADNGIDLSVSGHTHRGQMMPNHWITKRIFELDWGYKKIRGLHAVVSSGFGFWGPPIRIGSRSEVVRIEVEFRGAAT